MHSLAYHQAVILTTQLQPQLLYKHTSSYYILLGHNNQLQFRESHSTWAMIELEQTLALIYISSLVHLRHLTAHPMQCKTENDFTQVDCGLLDRQKSVH